MWLELCWIANRSFNMSRISVVLCTYNGASKIKRQLDSLINQTMQPDEVLIFDDASKDATVEKVQGYISRNALKGWKITVRPENLGWRRNFLEALKEADGDYLFLCDQDDVWHPDKIEIMVRTLDKHPETDLLLGRYRIIYEGKKNIRSNLMYYHTAALLWRPRKYAVIDAKRKWQYIMYPGCTFCLRGSFAKRALGFMDPELEHDSQLLNFAVADKKAAIINEVLTDYYRGASNASGGGIASAEARTDIIKTVSKRYDNTLAYLHSVGNVEGIKILEDGKRWLELRRQYLETGNKKALFEAATAYGGYYLSPSGILKDIRALRRDRS